MWPFSTHSNEESADDDASAKGLRYDQVREAENRRYLTELVGIRRAPEIQKRLLDVLRFEPSTAKRIDIVERLDRLGIESLSWYEDRISVVKAARARDDRERNRKTAYFFESPEYRSLSVEAREMLRELEPPPFFRRILHEHRKITAYGRRHGFLRSNLLRLRHETTPLLLEYWNDGIKTLLEALENPLGRAVEHGWASLDIAHYNVLVRFAGFVRDWCAAIPLLQGKLPSRIVWIKIRPLARAWASLALDARGRELALDALAQFLRANGAEGPQLRRTVAAAETLFETTRTGQTFMNALLSVWMLLSGRFIEADELVPLLKPEPLEADAWQGTPETLEKIGAFIDARRGEYDEARKNLLLLDEIGISGAATMDERSCDAAWHLFVEAQHVLPEAGRTAASQCRQTVRADLAAFTERSAANLVYVFTVLLRDGILAESGLGRELATLERALTAMRTIRQIRDRLVIPDALYDAFLRGGRGATDAGDAEAGFMSAMKEAAAPVIQAGLKLQQIVSQAAGLANLAGSRAREAAGLLTDPAAMLEEPPVLKGLRVREALARLQGWCLGLAWLLGEPTLKGLVQRRDDCEAEAADLAATLARMGRPVE